MMEEDDFRKLTARLVSERGGASWKKMEELLSLHFGSMSELLHDNGYGVWVDPTTGKKYEAHVTMQVGVSDLDEDVEFH